MRSVVSLRSVVGIVDAVDPKHEVEKDADKEQTEECENDREDDEENTLHDLVVIDLPNARDQ
jgi:hypothetical protein